MSTAAPIAILILGMHRSGTSAVTRVMNLLGVDLGSNLKVPAADNPLGFWEHEEVLGIHEALIKALERAWDDPRPLPVDWLQHPASAIAGEAIAGLIEREFADAPLWAIKDPRICRFVPLWRRELARAGIEPRALIVSRNPVEVAQSLAKRNDLPDGVGQLLWARYTQEAEEGSRGLRRCAIDYEQLLGDWRRTISRINTDLELGLRVDPNAGTQIDVFLSNSLRHHRAAGGQMQEFATPLFEALQEPATSEARLAALAAAAREFRLDAQRYLPVISGLAEMLAAERQRLAAAQGEVTEVGDALVASTKWGISRDEELARVQARVGELLQEVQESTAWGASRDVELRKVLDRAEALRSELVESTDWGASRDAELCKALDRAEALHSELVDSVAWAASRDSDLRQVTATLESVVGQRDQLQVELEERAREMEQLSESIRQDLQKLRDEVSSRSSQHETELGAARQARTQKQRELDGLQHQANTLHSRVAALEHHLYTAGVINRLRRLRARVAGAARRWVKIGIVRATHLLPGTAERKHARVAHLRNLNEARKSGANSVSILRDVHDLAVDRWPARPAYLLRPERDAGVAELDISVVVYESQRWVDGFMSSLLASDYPLGKINLHIRDHSPGMATRLAFERFIAEYGCPFASYDYSSGRNVGFGGGHNHNFRQGRTDYFLVCNVDGRFQSDTLRMLMRAAATSGDSVAAWELRQTPYEHPKYYDPVTMLTTWVSGACVLFLRKAYCEVGGFDDLIFMYGEDVDLSYRLRGHGYRLAYVPQAVFQHDSYAEPEQFKPLQFHGSGLANALLRLRFGTLSDLLAIPSMWRELGRSAHQQGVYGGFRRNTLKLAVLGPLFFFSRYRRGSARIPFARWDFGLRRDGAFEPVLPIQQPLPLVSIIVRTYRGRGDLLRQALASIANQTYPNIEVVVVEDKGTELQEIAETCARTFGLDLTYLSCLTPDSNRCLTGNLGLSAARGEYVNFLDDDDLFFADQVEFLLSRLNPDEGLGACYSLAWETKVAADPAHPGRYLEVMHSSHQGHKREFDRQLLGTINYIPIQAVLFRRQLFELYGGFDQRLENLEDWELWRRYSWLHDFKYCPKTTSLYHVPADPHAHAERQSRLDVYFPIADRIATQAREHLQSAETP